MRVEGVETASRSSPAAWSRRPPMNWSPRSTTGCRSSSRRRATASGSTPENLESRLVALLKAYPAEAMQVTAASTAVNSPKNDGPECVWKLRDYLRGAAGNGRTIRSRISRQRKAQWTPTHFLVRYTRVRRSNRLQLFFLIGFAASGRMHSMLTPSFNFDHSCSAVSARLRVAIAVARQRGRQRKRSGPPRCRAQGWPRSPQPFSASKGWMVSFQLAQPEQPVLDGDVLVEQFGQAFSRS